jgi:hypothetical protein
MRCCLDAGDPVAVRSQAGTDQTLLVKTASRVMSTDLEMLREMWAIPSAENQLSTALHA